ncbi:MAG: hypothetical protein HRU41_41670 [Saprospiraceae bacterium]|nr:hypothetical protein [Saprospiraceae bacterium]
MDLSLTQQIYITQLLHRLLLVPGINRIAVLDTLATPIEEFQEADWDWIHIAILLPIESIENQMTFLQFVQNVPP